MASPIFYLSLLLLFHLNPAHQAVVAAGGELVYEDGYTVSTVLDGDKSNLKVNPHSLLHQSTPSDLFVLLDSAASTFYTVSLPTTSNKTEMQRLVGNGEHSYTDGELGLARFNKPRSFAVDFSGNVYVADQRNHAIRKITKSRVSTIAGGYSQKAGRTDGPGKDASFSDDFELTFIAQRCALMISDHGNRLVRQINLKTADCTRHSGSVLGSTSAWLLGLGLSCLFGLIVGFVIHPYVIPYEGLAPHHPTWTWTPCLMSLERQIVMLCSDIRNAVVKSTAYLLFHQIILLVLSYLSLMVRPMLMESRRTCEKSVSLLDLDEVSSSSSSNVIMSSEADDQLKDLLTFDGGVFSLVNANELVEQEEEKETTDVSSGKPEKIDKMILANLMNFEEEATRVFSPRSTQPGLGLVKRR
ncbi:uncharacterized protein LOC105168235 isoform X1 [Sesamum indicum]|uniref:Uncharacterized protein LOC105168235 isoform X1 n=1 Tax=Sesamum indicum TaxID=4182 RepID=A0A6I9TSG2_SESIN|nr:uncharacterized protein LOC105168235 isoform X1 [Sesamum indicum]